MSRAIAAAMLAVLALAACGKRGTPRVPAPEPAAEAPAPQPQGAPTTGAGSAPDPEAPAIGEPTW